MSLSDNLLYLLLLYAVLDKEDRISPTTGILVALGVMLFGYCRSALNACCGRNVGFAETFSSNPFRAANSMA